MTKQTRTMFIGLATLLVFGGAAACESEIDDKPKAKVEAAEQPAAKAEGGEAKPAADAKTLTLAEGSTVGFIGAKVTGDHKGSFDKLEGKATVEGGKLTAVEISVDMSSMKTDADDLTGHLMSPDFFNVAEHPKSTFTMLSVTEKPGEGGATHEVAGNLEMVGKANKVTFPATLEVSDAGVHGKAEFVINRKDWGIIYAGKPDDLIKDDVALSLDLSFE